MNTARIVVLVPAIGAGGVAAYLASGTDRKVKPLPVAAQIETVDVLIAKSALPLGQSITADDMQWLAIDQTIEEKNGLKVVVGETATLELKPEQTETLVRARQSGARSLALRSIADAPQQQVEESKRRRQDTINVVRFGVTTPTTTSK